MDLEKIRAIQEENEKYRRLREQFDPFQEAIEKRRRLIEEASGPMEKILRAQRAIDELGGVSQALKQAGLDSPRAKWLRDEKALVDFCSGNYARKFDDEFRALMRGRIEGLQNSASSVLFDAAKGASLSVIKTFENLRLETLASARMDSVSKIWAEQIRGVQKGMGEHILGAHFSRISEVSFLAQSSIAGVKAEAIGSVLKSVTDAALMATKFTSFSRSYEGLFKSFEESQTRFLALPPMLSRLPSVEFFNGADLIRSTSVDEPEEEYLEEKAIVREEIQAETRDALESLLYQLNPEFIKMREGAVALHSIVDIIPTSQSGL